MTEATALSKFEIKKYKSYKGMSRETQAFQAEVWHEGRKLCDVRNDGNGGCHEIWPHSAVPILTETARKMQKIFYCGVYLENDADSVIDRLLSHLEARKELTKLFKKYLVFITEGKCYQSTSIQAVIKGKWSDAVVLNTLPFEEALSLYMTATDDLNYGQ